MTEERKTARLDLRVFRPKATLPIDPSQDQQAVAAGKILGFSGRADVAKIDGRTLRRKNKTQMNMRVSLSVQNDFKQVAAEFSDVDACLSYLIELFRKYKDH